MNKKLSTISLALLVSFVTPVNVAVGSTDAIEVAQESGASTEDIRAAAEEAYQEGLRLYQEGTAESLRDAIVKCEEVT